MQISRILKKGTTFPSWVITGLENTETRCAVLDRRVVHEPTRISSNTDLSTAIHFSQHGPAFKMNFISLTIVPLLKSEPLAQNELVIRSRGVTVLVSRFHNAPQAE